MIQEQAETSLSVAEAFSMFRMHCSATDVRQAADLAIKVMDNVIGNPTDSKYAETIYFCLFPSRFFTVWNYSVSDAIVIIDSVSK